MQKVVVSVMDLKAGCFATPWFVPSAAVAVREFRDEVNRVVKPGENANQLNRHPEDFQLWQLGIFDDNTGTFDEPGARLLIAASSCLGDSET